MCARDLNINFVNSLITQGVTEDKLHLDRVRHGVSLDHELVMDLYDILRPLHPALLRPSDLLTVHKELNIHIDSFSVLPSGNFCWIHFSIVSTLTISNSCDDIEVILIMAIDGIFVGHD